MVCHAALLICLSIERASQFFVSNSIYLSSSTSLSLSLSLLHQCFFMLILFCFNLPAISWPVCGKRSF